MRYFDLDHRSVNEVKALLDGRLGSSLTPSLQTDEPEQDLVRFVNELHTWLSRPAASVAEYETTTDLSDNSLGEMTTISGKIVYPLNMRLQDFNITDIAHHLARTCRYNGAVSGFLSVAEHSVMVAKLVEDGPEPWFALEALMHDGMEAYIGDIIRPIKHLPEFQPVRDAEERGEKVMAEFFGLAYPMPAVVKAADRQRLYDEIEHLRFNPRANTPATTAKGIFLATFERLSHDRKTIWADKLAELGIVSMNATEEELKLGAEMLDLEMGENDAGAPTIRHYLALLAWGVWDEDEGFDGRDELIDTLVKHQWIVEDDREQGDRLIRQAITAMGSPSTPQRPQAVSSVTQALIIAEASLVRAQRILDELKHVGFAARPDAIAEAHALANVAMGWIHLAKVQS